MNKFVVVSVSLSELYYSSVLIVNADNALNALYAGLVEYYGSEEDKECIQKEFDYLQSIAIISKDLKKLGVNCEESGWIVYQI